MFDMDKVGKKIAKLRKSHNMTQPELADKMGISFQAVSNWERGNSMPDIAKLPELAELFHTTVDKLLGEKSELVESAARGELEKYLEDNPISSEELCNAAPILKPDQMTVILESQKEIDISELNCILPFLNEDTVDKISLMLYQRSGLDEMIKVAPFISDEQLRQFADLEYASNGLCGLSSIAPFLDSDYLNELAKKAVRKDGIKAISCIAPFLDSEVLSEWVKEVYGLKNSL